MKYKFDRETDSLQILTDVGYKTIHNFDASILYNWAKEIHFQSEQLLQLALQNKISSEKDLPTGCIGETFWIPENKKDFH